MWSAPDMLAAAGQLGVEAVAVMIGSGPLKEAVRERARALDVEPRVRLVGWQDNPAQAFFGADVFVTPRLSARPGRWGAEGLGLSVVEAK